MSSCCTQGPEGRPSRILGLVLVTLFAGLGCSQAERERTAGPPDVALQRAVVARYAELAYLGYAAAAQAAEGVHSAVKTLTSSPSQASLDAARRAWLAAREPYLQTEVFRFYDGPIDALDRWINPWPIDESYVEGSSGSDKHGVIDDPSTYPTLSEELLLSLNEKQGETSISTGYHVIEFLLWGRDEQADGPGARSHLDFVTSASDTHAARRAEYLLLATQLLAKQLAHVRDAWAPGQVRNYRAQFSKASGEEALAQILKGMGTLSGGELAGERLTVAYETKDSENEHSCFSDNTHRDVVGDALGIQNVCLGRYVAPDGKVSDGPGVCELLVREDRKLASELTTQIGLSVQAAKAIPSPFDQAILGPDTAVGRRKIQSTIASLLAQTALLSQAAIKLGAAKPVASR